LYIKESLKDEFKRVGVIKDLLVRIIQKTRKRTKIKGMFFFLKKFSRRGSALTGIYFKL